MFHCRGVKLTPEKRARIKVPLEKLNHFLEFITSARVVQDQPFGEKTLKLSSTEIKIPNVVRTSIPQQIVKQYQSYCTETGFSFPLSRSSLSYFRLFYKKLKCSWVRVRFLVKEETKFVLTQAEKNIEAWKAHIVLSADQDAACLDILNALDDTSVLVVQD